MYQDIIQQFVSQLEKCERRRWLLQDNARSHVLMNTISFLPEFSNEHLTSTNLWLPHNPDIIPLDFFLWGYLKNCVYMTAPRNFEELKGNIAWEIENIDRKTLRHVFLNLMKRCLICKANSGGHFQHLL